MIDRLYFKNYRGFEEHTISLRPLTVFVGQNNAGKSTIVEALRLITFVSQKMKNLKFVPPPLWTGLYKSTKGVLTCPI